jgi:hypothetical protein
MPRVPTALVVAGIFFAQAVVLALVVQWAPRAVFLIGPIAGFIGAGACLAAGRVRLAKPASEEPWGLNAWGSALGGLALPVLGWSVGPEAATMGWLLAALHVGLGAMALAGRA